MSYEFKSTSYEFKFTNHFKSVQTQVNSLKSSSSRQVVRQLVRSVSGDNLLFFVSTRSSRPEVFCKKGALSNFAKFTGKHLCQSLFFNKVAGLRPATLLKKRLWHRCFPVNFAKFLRTPFFTEHLWWLLLSPPLHGYGFSRKLSE